MSRTNSALTPPVSLPNHVTRVYGGVVLERLRQLPPGGKMADLPPELQHESFVRIGPKKTGGPNLRLLRLEMDQPALTVTAYIYNKFVHPTEDRYITPREAACLQDFPVQYEFCGPLAHVHQQIGNAVPVRLAKAIAQEVTRYFQRLGQCGLISIYSYFTGAGGLDLGFELASTEEITFQTVLATDIDASCRETVERNRPDWNFFLCDLRNVSPDEACRRAGNRAPDVIIGGPPCQPFSVAGKQKATSDPLGTLYRDFIHQIDVLRPSIVVMENVYGLAQVKSANMIQEIQDSFHKIGYQVQCRELNAADYGTPQKRRRLFFIASQRLDLFQFPAPTHAPGANLLGLPSYSGAGASFAHLPQPLLKP